MNNEINEIAKKMELLKDLRVLLHSDSTRRSEVYSCPRLLADL